MPGLQPRPRLPPGCRGAGRLRPGRRGRRAPRQGGGPRGPRAFDRARLPPPGPRRDAGQHLGHAVAGLGSAAPQRAGGCRRAVGPRDRGSGARTGLPRSTAPPPTSGSSATPSAAAWGPWAGPSASPRTGSAGSSSSRPTDRSGGDRRVRTRTLLGPAGRQVLGRHRHRTRVRPGSRAARLRRRDLLCRIRRGGRHARLRRLGPGAAGVDHRVHRPAQVARRRADPRAAARKTLRPPALCPCRRRSGRGCAAGTDAPGGHPARGPGGHDALHGHRLGPPGPDRSDAGVGRLAAAARAGRRGHRRPAGGRGARRTTFR